MKRDISRDAGVRVTTIKGARFLRDIGSARIMSEETRQYGDRVAEPAQDTPIGGRKFFQGIREFYSLRCLGQLTFARTIILVYQDGRGAGMPYTVVEGYKLQDLFHEGRVYTPENILAGETRFRVVNEGFGRVCGKA